MKKAITLLSEIICNLERPPSLSLSEWTAEHRIISSQESSVPGRWNPDFMPYQQGIMDAITNPEVETVVMMCSTRVSKTFIATCAIGYYCHLDPAPILIVKPRGSDCDSFSKEELQWLFLNTPALQDKLAANEGKTSTNTLHFKQLTTGGSIRLAGSNSPAALSGFGSRIVILDEVDKYEPIVGFGNPIDMAIGRTTTFPHNKKIIILSSPTLEHSPDSKRKTIHSEFLKTSQAYYHIPCPYCGHFQYIDWDNVKYAHCKEKLDDVYIECVSCSKHITEQQKKLAILDGKWVDTFPANTKAKGFHISQLYSPFNSLEKVCGEWLPISNSRDIYSIQRFKNEVLGLPFKEDLGLYKDSSDHLFNRRERYKLIPSNVYLLTMAVDTQDTWLSYTITGWGIDRECWIIESGRIDGDPATPVPWEELYKKIIKKYKHELGVTLGIEKVFIDTQGHKTQHVNKFLKGKAPQVQGIYGAKQSGKPIITKPKRDTHTGLRKWEIGTENAKTDIFQMLATEKPGPLYIHFPFELDEEYFKELYSERKDSYGKFHKIGSRRNEKLDELGYNLAAYYVCIKNYSIEQRKDIILGTVKEMNEPEELEESEEGTSQTPEAIPAPPMAPVVPVEPIKLTEEPEIKILSPKERYLAKFKHKNTISGPISTQFWNDDFNL